MKIVHVINSLGKGGAEKLLSELLPIQIKLGCEVYLVVLTSQQNVFEHDLLSSNIKPIYLSDDKTVLHPKFIFRIKRVLKKIKPDVVQVHLFPSQYFTVFTTTAPLIFTEHGTTSKRRKLIFKPIEKFIYSKYIKYIFVSKNSKKSFETYIGFNNNQKNKVIFNGINLETREIDIDFDLRKRLKLDNNSRIITMISSFKAEKDHETLLKSIINEPTWNILFLGEGETQNIIKAKAREYNIEDRVYFVGYQRNVYNYIYQSDIIVQSSFFEGFGLSVLEAMSCSKPVLVSDIEGLKELVNNRDYRFNSHIELHNKISLLLNDEIKYEDAIKYSEDRSSNFSIEKTAKMYIELYKEIIKN